MNMVPSGKQSVQPHCRTGNSHVSSPNLTMNVDCVIQLGLYGPSRKLNPILLDVNSVGAAASWAGSYHILQMGRHYDDYVVSSRIPGLPSIPGFPSAHPYQRLTGKIRATGVTGNIGECVAALFARRYLNTGVQDIAAIRPRQPFARKRAPDYMMRLGDAVPAQFSTIMPPGAASNLGAIYEWWPVESKARSTMSGTRNARREALRQLQTYWRLIAASEPTAVGIGLISTFAYNVPRELRVSLLLPKNRPSLVDLMTNANSTSDDVNIEGHLYGC